MGVEPTHDFADHASTLDVSAVRSQAHLGHLEQDATLHGFQAVACIRQGSGVDDRIRVFQKGRTHLVRDVGVEYPTTRRRGLSRTWLSGLACRLTRH